MDGKGEGNESIRSACSLPNLEEVLGVAGNIEETKEKPESCKNIPDDLFKLADITIDKEKKTKKITKEDFLNPSEQMSRIDPTDPLSQLDPLWSLK